MSWLLPVGTPAGICTGLVDAPDGSGFVACGEARLNLDADLYRLWRAAAAAPEPEELLGWAAGNEIPEAGRGLVELIDEGLIVEGGAGAEQRIGRLTLRLIGECIGNGSSPAPGFGVLGRDGTRLDVDPFTNEVLLRADQATPLEQLCELLDGTRPEPVARSSLQALAAWLPLLVRAGAVRLERVAGA